MLRATLLYKLVRDCLFGSFFLVKKILLITILLERVYFFGDLSVFDI